jgi:hypothetical protein
MALRCIVGLVLCVSFMLVTPGIAADRVPNEAVAASAAAIGAAAPALGIGDAEPRISGALSPRIDRKLREAFPVALQRVRDVSECRELFTRLGTDALEKFTSSIYYPTTAQMEDRVCQRGVSAFTYVSSPQTRLCRGFSSLGAERAAVTLIHEALHWAGLSEKPLDEEGMDARDIDRMVKKACDL